MLSAELLSNAGAHVADGSHSSVKTAHAAIIYIAPGTYLLQPINGEIRMMCASEQGPATKLY